MTCWKTDDALYLEANTEKGNCAAGIAFVADRRRGRKSRLQSSRKTDPRAPGKAAACEPHGRQVRRGQDRRILQVTPHGQSCRSPASAAEPAPLSARPASATTSRISTPDTASSASAAGIPACIPSLPKCRQDSRVLTQLERFRQRFMHKLVYFPTNNDGDVLLRRLRQMSCKVPDSDEYCQGHEKVRRAGQWLR